MNGCMQDRVKEMRETENKKNCHGHSDEDRQGCCQGIEGTRLSCLRKEISLAYTSCWAMAKTIVVID